MKFVKTYRYDQSVEEIAASYLDEDFLLGKMETLGARNVSVQIEAYEDGSYEVNIDREEKADVPGPLKSVLKPWNKLNQKETWNGQDGGPYEANILVQGEGIPAKISFQLSLSEKGTGCEYKANVNIVCNIPFLGKKLEKFIGKATEDSLNDEHEYIRDNA